MSSNPSTQLVQLGTSEKISRRSAIQWVIAASAAASLRNITDGKPADFASPSSTAAQGYGPDPNLLKVYKPGDLWPLTFTDGQRITAAALADTIIPSDQYGPAASAVGVIEMIDEWISAPYPQQKGDRPVILDGLRWLNDESNKRFGQSFDKLTPARRSQICDEICLTAKAKPELRKPASFFGKFRSLCASAYYATPAGWHAIGYVGNVPLPGFDGPPAEVLEKLGVTQTVS